MTHENLSPHALRVADLPQSQTAEILLVASESERAALQQALDLLDLRKVRLSGTLRPLGTTDWHLSAQLGATVVQTCVATLDPVTTRIETTIERAFMRDFVEDDAPETEMTEDDHIEPLGTHIDPYAVLLEALSLALPVYPRAPDADPIEIRVTEPGKQAMRDEDARPFAGLAALKTQLQDPNDDNS